MKRRLLSKSFNLFYLFSSPGHYRDKEQITRQHDGE